MPTAAEVKKLREETGLPMDEARRELERRAMVALLDQPDWWLHICPYLITRNR